MSNLVSIVEVGVRDGLQNEASVLRTADKVKLIERLSDAGLKRIELGAFVSPRWVPQMADTDHVIKQVRKKPGLTKNFKHFSTLVPNIYGMEQAVALGVKEVAIFGACSEAFSQKNINCSIEASFRRFEEVVKLARKNKISVRGYLSTAFGCPYEGPVKPKKVVQLAERMLDLGVFEVSIGDTIGVATPLQVKALVSELLKARSSKSWALHFHNTRGTALANVLQSLQLGIRTFDSSIGGLGGCPYAKGASGNLATEDLVYMLGGMGMKSRVSLESLLSIQKWLEKKIGRRLPAHVRDFQS